MPLTLPRLALAHARSAWRVFKRSTWVLPLPQTKHQQSRADQGAGSCAQLMPLWFSPLLEPPEGSAHRTLITAPSRGWMSHEGAILICKCTQLYSTAWSELGGSSEIPEPRFRAACNVSSISPYKQASLWPCVAAISAGRLASIFPFGQPCQVPFLGVRNHKPEAKILSDVVGLIWGSS